jgi:hypothetical protein
MSEPQIQGWGLDQERPEAEKRADGVMRRHESRLKPTLLVFVTTRFKPDAFLFWHGCRLTRAVRQ